VSTELEAKAREGACVLLSVEADRRAGEETPRFTARGLQSFEGMTANARLILDIETAEPEALFALAALLEGHGGGRGEAWLNAILPDGGTARILLGRNYLLDAELAANVERLPGVKALLRPAPPPQLALVS
jgi:DNA polymerase-3 subunit alpha